MKRKTLSFSGGEPITTAEAKSHCRIEISTDDTLIDTYISTARNLAEAYTGLKLVNYKYRLSYDLRQLKTVNCLEVINDIGSIDLFKAYDDADLETNVALILPLPYSFRDNRLFVTTDALALGTRQYDAFVIEYTCVKTTATADIKHALYLMVAHFYENRESVLQAEFDFKYLPQGVLAILQKYKVYTV